ncbi:hypothetical protein AALB81_17425 [Lachnospiraceae bacterium 48-33]
MRKLFCIKLMATEFLSSIVYFLFCSESIYHNFNEKLFHRLVDYATVYSNGKVVFTFHNGVEVGTGI